MKGSLALGLVACLSGCSWFKQTPPKPNIVPAHDVINQVKDEIRVFWDIGTKTVPAGAGAICKGPHGDTVIALVPKKIKLTLQTVVATENDGSVGLGNPIGVISIDPSYENDYTVSNAHSIEVDFEIPKNQPPFKGEKLDPSKFPLAAAIENFREELLKVDHTKAPCLKPTDLTSTINFDVVKRQTGGLGITLGVFKLSDKLTRSNEYHQTLEVDFAMTGSTLLIQ